MRLTGTEIDTIIACLRSADPIRRKLEGFRNRSNWPGMEQVYDITHDPTGSYAKNEPGDRTATLQTLGGEA